MKRLRVLASLVVLLFICSSKAYGQSKADDPYFVETAEVVSKYGPWHITREILQDRKGNIWFATWQGIIKYDGKRFTNYTLKYGLIHFHVLVCYEDKRGILWFGMPRGGVYRYDGNTFKLYTTKNGLGDNTVECITEDQQGNIWFATNRGATRYNGRQFRNFTTNDGLCEDHVNSVICDSTGKLWMGTSKGISIYNGRSFSNFLNKDGLPFKQVYSLFEDSKGKIWIGRMNGLTIYDGRSFEEPLSDHLTYYMAEDKAGNVWLSHSEPNTRNENVPNQVLYKYDGKRFIKILEKNEGNDFQIFGKLVDKEGNIWFGTMHGPCRYDGKSFTYFAKRDAN